MNVCRQAHAVSVARTWHRPWPQGAPLLAPLITALGLQILGRNALIDLPPLPHYRKRGGFLLTLQEKIKKLAGAPQAPAGAGSADGAARRRRRRRRKRISSRRRRRRRRGRSRCLRCLRAHGEQGGAQACDCLRDAFLALSDAFLATRSSRRVPRAVRRRQQGEAL